MAAWLGPGIPLSTPDPAVICCFVAIPGTGKTVLTAGLESCLKGEKEMRGEREREERGGREERGERGKGGLESCLKGEREEGEREREREARRTTAGKSSRPAVLPH